jgi:hypothetical protein
MFSISLILAAASTAAAATTATQWGNRNCSDIELVIGKMSLHSQQILSNAILIARGTTEPLAPKYGEIVGDPLFNATIADFAKSQGKVNVTGYAVNVRP